MTVQGSQLKHAWYVAAESRRLRDKPVAVQVCGESLVLFRGADGKAVALEDRCSHRAVALSRGKVAGGCVVCPYHGWTFDGAGKCVAIPANRAQDPIPSGSGVPSYRLREQDGYIWVWPGAGQPGGTQDGQPGGTQDGQPGGTQDGQPGGEQDGQPGGEQDGQPDGGSAGHASEGPFRIPHLGERGWAWARFEARIQNNVLNVIENFIDNPHTGYIHGGLFRSPASHLTHHHVQSVPDGVVIDIDEEAKGESLLARLFLKQGGRVEHQDRFIAPSTVQVAYTFGPSKLAVGWQFCTPVSETETHVFVHVTWSAGLLTPVLKLFVPIVGKVILAQDVVILDHQGEQLRKFGDRATFCSTQADTANLWIAGQRRRAAAGDPPGKPHEKRVTFRV